MNNIELANKAKEIATKYKTLYVLGCFGAPLNEANKKRYTTNYTYNAQPSRKAMIYAATDDTFGFDCVCLIKGILWGWDGDVNAVYGGAKYASNGVPDIDANTMINRCSSVSKDFSKVEIGEVVWMQDHIGIYIGDGLAVECSPAWENKVQITACNCNRAGYHRRDWTKHGKLPYITYIKVDKDITLYKKDNKWLYMPDGKTVDKSYIGLAKNEFGWWYVKNGTIDFTYNGTAKNQYGTWNVVNGKVTTKAQEEKTMPVLKKGSKSEDVKILQQKLNSKGYKLTVDGIFGNKTLEAVKDFQEKNGLLVDGIVGKNTWAKLG